MFPQTGNSTKKFRLRSLTARWPNLRNPASLKPLPLTHPARLWIRNLRLELINRELGKFRLESEIARGGMGIILKARDLELDRSVAVKLLRKIHKGKPQHHQQFTHEAPNHWSAAASRHHPDL